MCPKCGCSPAAENQPAAGHSAPGPFAKDGAAADQAAATGPKRSEALVPSKQQEPVVEWYYVTESGRNGPVSRERLQKLAAEGEIHDQTLVWKIGMADWGALSRHREAVELACATPPPVARRPASKWYLWALAFAPLWGALLQVVATEVWVALTHKNLSYYSQLWWIIVLANLAAAALDFGALKKSGQDVARLDKGMFLLVPVYLYLREKKLNAQFLRLGVWAGSTLLSLSGSLYLNGLYARLLTR